MKLKSVARERKKIEAVLQALVGLPLTDMFRYIGNQMFEFGPQRSSPGGEPGASASDWGLVAACDWQIADEKGFTLGSADFIGKRRDQHGDSFYSGLSTDPPTVLGVSVALNGAVSVRLTHGLTLDITPSGPKERGEEQWIYLPPDDVGGSIFLCEGGYAYPALEP